MFGIVPGSCYGWPKNVLHWAGIDSAILDINAAVRPDFAIVDGIVGMQGNGPLQGEPKNSGVLILGDDPVAVDATCCRVMGLLPAKVKYLAQAGSLLGHIQQEKIEQLGESIASVRTPFSVLDNFKHLVDTSAAFGTQPALVGLRRWANRSGVYPNVDTAEANRRDQLETRRSDQRRAVSAGDFPRAQGGRGQSLLEMALVLPMFLMLICAVVDFSHVFYVEMTLQNALRQAGRFATTGNHLADPNNPGQNLSRVNSIIATAQQAASGLNVTSNSINISSVARRRGQRRWSGRHCNDLNEQQRTNVDPDHGPIFQAQWRLQLYGERYFQERAFSPGADDLGQTWRIDERNMALGALKL